VSASLPPRLQHGVDLVEVERLRDAMARTPSFETRVFTEGERRYCRERADPVIHYAARFAAKEAALKALGLGITPLGIDAAFQDIEVVRDQGPPRLLLSGRPRAAAHRQGVTSTSLSLSHTDGHAVASVVMLAAPAAGETREA